MAVLNTTSPPATPSAPAAAPRKDAPSSNARIASTLVLRPWFLVLSPFLVIFPDPFSVPPLLVPGPFRRNQGPRMDQGPRTDHGPRTDPGPGTDQAPSTKDQGPSSSVQRRRHPVPFAGDDADRRRPAAIAVALEANRMLARAHAWQRERRRTHELAVHEYSGAGRPRVDHERASDPLAGAGRRRHARRRHTARGRIAGPLERDDHRLRQPRRRDRDAAFLRGITVAGDPDAMGTGREIPDGNRRLSVLAVVDENSRPRWRRPHEQPPDRAVSLRTRDFRLRRSR